MKAYKAFNHDLSCRGFKYAIGQTYIHGGAVRLCDSGFHACEAPIDVLGYYPPTARFAEVTLGGVSDEQQADSKRVAAEITIDRGLSLGELIAAQVAYVKATGSGESTAGDRSTAASSGDYSTAASSGDGSKAASVGYRSTAASSGKYSTAASSGDYSTAASSGTGSKAASSGYGSKAASSGDHSTAASSGDYSKAASSGNGSTAASSGDHSTAASSGTGSKAASSGNGSTAASSGDYSKAASSGDYSTVASSGDYSKAASSGERTIAMVAGLHGQAKAGPHGAFALPWLDGDQVRIAVGIIGENGIKPDTWYCAGDQGQLIEVKE
jgi:hypothetical protein